MLNKHDFYQENRQKLMALLPEKSAVIVPSGSEQIRNRDVEFPFRAESDFFYLTGFEEPDSVLLLIKSKGAESPFLRPKDPEQETWQGRRLGVDAAPNFLSVDEAYEIDELDEEIVALLEGIDSVYVSFSQSLDFLGSINVWISAVKQKVRKGVSAPSQRFCDLDSNLHELRLFKSEEEIQRMRQAAQISVQGHLAAMKSVSPGKFEFEVQSELEAAFMKAGAPRVAFNSIVASGDNACILHYTENRAEISAGDLVLVDAGAEWLGYAGDITTTFPASGRFSPEQAALYSLVLKAQHAAIEKIKPGVSYDQAHQASIKVLTQGLIDLGILHGQLDKLIKDECYKPFFMHGTGHWLGMDVHDVGLYKINQVWRDFEVGMVVTAEPGLYISAEHETVDSKWHGIGIRIEDDILVTETGNEVLTSGLPRTVEEIESWMAQS